MKKTLNPPNTQPKWLNIILSMWLVIFVIAVIVILCIVGAYFQSPVYQMHQVGMG